MKVKRLSAYLLAAFLAAAIAPSAFAMHSPTHYTLFGDAEYVSPGNASDRAVELVSDADPAYGGIDYGVEDGLTFEELTTLSTDYLLPEDACVGGSPRFQINLDEDGDGVSDGNVFAYFGTDSGGAACVTGTWANTGDFLETGRLLDTSQLGGTFYDTYANALATYGDYEVVGIQVVTDSSWASGGEHIVQIDNTLINETLFTYEIPTPVAASECKNGGWKTLADNDGNGFKNQGDCVSFVATKGKNAGAGA